MNDTQTGTAAAIVCGVVGMAILVAGVCLLCYALMDLARML